MSKPKFSDVLLRSVACGPLQEVIDGNSEAVLEAFTWAASPQGIYWGEVQETGLLTDEDRAYLIRLRDAALEREKANG